jgi:hypothetical protein
VTTTVLLTVGSTAAVLTFFLLLAVALFLSAECRQVQATLNRLYCEQTKLKMSLVPDAKPESWEEAAHGPVAQSR